MTIMESLKIKNLNHFVKTMVLVIISRLRTLQQNGIIERKIRTLQEMVRTMLYENNLPKYF